MYFRHDRLHHSMVVTFRKDDDEAIVSKNRINFIVNDAIFRSRTFPNNLYNLHFQCIDLDSSYIRGVAKDPPSTKYNTWNRWLVIELNSIMRNDVRERKNKIPLSLLIYRQEKDEIKVRPWSDQSMFVLTKEATTEHERVERNEDHAYVSPIEYKFLVGLHKRTATLQQSLAHSQLSHASSPAVYIVTAATGTSVLVPLPCTNVEIRCGCRGWWVLEAVICFSGSCQLGSQ